MTTIQQMYEDSQRVKDKDAFLAKFTNCNVVSTAEQDVDEEAWLKARTLGIGGSDIGTICGVNKYSSPRALFFKKTGQYENAEFAEFSEASKERMHFGHKLEPIVADEFIRREEKKVVICPATLAHKDYPWALANVDRVIVDDDENPIGILEIKTADARLLKDWEEGDLPHSYLYQLQWYLFVTNLKYGAIAALIGGNRYIMYEVYRDDSLVNDVMVPAADKFWNTNVRELVVPEVTGSDMDAQINKELYGDAIPESEILLQTEEDDALAELIVATKEQIKQLKKIEADAINKFQAKMGRNIRALTTERTVTWSPYSTRRVNNDLLKERYPDIYEEVRTSSPARRFTIK